MKVVFTLFFILLIFGLVVLASAGLIDAQRRFDQPYYYLWHQLLYGVLPGCLVMFLFSKMPIARWRTFALPILVIAIGLMVLVMVPGIGLSIKGASRWLDLRIVTVQPAEFLKFALIIYLAAWFGGRHEHAHKIVALVPFLLILGFVGFLLALQPDFGTLGIVVLISVALYFFSGAKLSHFVALLTIFLIGALVLSFAAPYRFDRIKTFLNPHEDKQATGYHLNQAKIAIGSGGMLGVGYGHSRQKAGFLPEPVGDSIFAIMVEELGLVGGAGFLLLLLAFLISLLRLGVQTNDPFARLIVLGVAVWIGGQAFINIAAITGLLPLTGIPLPLMSYGSSQLVSIMGTMGVVWKVASRAAT